MRLTRVCVRAASLMVSGVRTPNWRCERANTCYNYVLIMPSIAIGHNEPLIVANNARQPAELSSQVGDLSLGWPAGVLIECAI